MKFNSEINTDIALLLNVARPKLIAADQGQSELFNEVGKEFGPIAHRIYLSLDKPERVANRYHNKETRRVLLDPWTVLNRANGLEGISIDEEEFWCHSDMIKTLCDYIDMRNDSIRDFLQNIDDSSIELVNN